MNAYTATGEEALDRALWENELNDGLYIEQDEWWQEDLIWLRDVNDVLHLDERDVTAQTDLSWVSDLNDVVYVEPDVAAEVDMTWVGEINDVLYYAEASQLPGNLAVLRPRRRDVASGPKAA